MRVAFAFSIAVAAFAGVASLSAQQAPGVLPAPSSSASGDATTGPRLPPAQGATAFGNLFGKPGKPASTRPLQFTTPSLAQRAAERVSQQPAVVCGMVLIPADPTLDSAIRHVVPESGPTFAIRTVTPKDCRRR
jgi:hypothetical protein